MSQLNISDDRAQEMRSRANIIVRHYARGQHISFHVDEQECDNEVFGYILQNDHPNGNGLMFKRGIGKLLEN